MESFDDEMGMTYGMCGETRNAHRIFEPCWEDTTWDV